MSKDTISEPTYHPLASWLKGESLNTNEINQYVNQFNKFLEQDADPKKSKGFSEFLDQVESENHHLATLMRERAALGKEYTIDEEDGWVAALGDTKGYQGVKGAINTFNSMIAEDQERFVKAFDKTNPKMAEYLKNVKNGKASFTGYAASLAKATGKTIGLQVATTALNGAISFGASLALQGIQ